MGLDSLERPQRQSLPSQAPAKHVGVEPEPEPAPYARTGGAQRPGRSKWPAFILRTIFGSLTGRVATWPAGGIHRMGLVDEGLF
jgi:hypothetical protein